MGNKEYKYIYGPVPSWRLGSSLGIDPISKDEKMCSFDCVYCQLGRTRCLGDERAAFVPVEEVIKEIASLPLLEIDYLTFSGAGEPTLAENLGEMIRAVRRIRPEKIAVITNSSLMRREDVMKDLFPADLVVAKLDASSQDIFERINRPMKNITFDAVVRAIKDFRSCYKGKLALQIMFIEENKNFARELAQLAKEIAPDEIQLNAPLRPCGVKPLTKDQMAAIEGCFRFFKYRFLL